MMLADTFFKMQNCAKNKSCQQKSEESQSLRMDPETKIEKASMEQ